MGIDDPKLVMIDSLGGEIYLKPLSSAEINKVIGIEAEGMGSFEATSKGRKDPNTVGKMNIAKMNAATAKAQYEAIHISINNPKNEDKWNMDEIKALPKNAVTELYDCIMKISGADITVQDVKNFPQD